MSKKYSWGIGLLACALAVGWLLATPGVARAAADNFYPGVWNFEPVGPGLDNPNERNTDGLPLSKLAPFPRTDGRYFYSGGYQQTSPGTFVILDTKDKEDPIPTSVPVYDPILSPPPPHNHHGLDPWSNRRYDFIYQNPANIYSPCGDWVGVDFSNQAEIDAVVPTCWDPGWITRTHYTAYGTGKVLAVNAQRNGNASANRLSWTGISTWDVHDPKNATLLGRWNAPFEFDPVTRTYADVGGCHHFFDDGRYVYAGCEYAGFDNRILVIIDIHDPYNPTEVGQWWVPGQKDGEVKDWVNNNSFSNVIKYDSVETNKLRKYVGLHYATVYGNIGYFSWHQAGLIILDVRDKTNPKFLSRLDYLTPEFQADEPQSGMPSPDHEACQTNNGFDADGTDAACGNAHSGKLVPGGAGILAMTDEYFQCPYGHLRLIDVSDPTAPFILSHQILPTIEGEAESRTTDCSKSYTHRGPSTHLPTSLNNDILFVAWYGAGVRAIDIRDPNYPQEVGYYQYSIEDPEDNGGMACYDVIGGPGGLLYSSDSEDGVRVMRWLGTGRSGKIKE